MNTHLIVIDGQNDFCIPKGPGGEKGALVVPGAEQDMNRLADFIVKNGSRLREIHCTLDSHQSPHIAHPLFWTNTKGEHPTPFSVITADDAKNGVWFPSHPRLRTYKLPSGAVVDYGAYYTAELAKHGRYQLMVWPPHCRIGTWGHSLVPCFAEALLAWEEQAWKRLTKVDFVAKGSNVLTEHYSGVQADVPDTSDITTMLNTGLIDTLKDADEILITGEALSHCVANTITDIANNFGPDNVKKFILLEDTCSNVASCDAMGTAFVKDMKARGMRVTRTTDW